MCVGRINRRAGTLWGVYAGATVLPAGSDVGGNPHGHPSGMNSPCPQTGLCITGVKMLRVRGTPAVRCCAKMEAIGLNLLRAARVRRTE